MPSLAQSVVYLCGLSKFNASTRAFHLKKINEPLFLWSLTTRGHNPTDHLVNVNHITPLLLALIWYLLTPKKNIWHCGVVCMSFYRQSDESRESQVCGRCAAVKPQLSAKTASEQRGAAEFVLILIRFGTRNNIYTSHCVIWFNAKIRISFNGTLSESSVHFPPFTFFFLI